MGGRRGLFAKADYYRTQGREQGQLVGIGIATSDSMIERLSDSQLATHIANLRHDRLQHVNTLQKIATSVNAKIPEGGDMKQWLTTRKIALADLMGDTAILKAMRSNEDDTVAAYDRARNHDDAIQESRDFFEHALMDEKRHRVWMEKAAQA